MPDHDVCRPLLFDYCRCRPYCLLGANRWSQQIAVTYLQAPLQRRISGGNESRRGRDERPVLSRLKGLGERPIAGLGRSILSYFEGHRWLFFTPICRCFEFVKQCFVSHLGVCHNVALPLQTCCTRAKRSAKSS